MINGLSIASRAGFSMLELILVLVIISIVGALAGPILTPMFRGTMQGSIEMQTADDSYWAVSRITALASTALAVQVPGANELQLGLPAAGGTTNWVSFTFSGGQLLYEGELFWDRVFSFTPAFAAGLVQIDLKLVDAQHPTLSIDVFARNTL